MVKKVLLLCLLFVLALLGGTKFASLYWWDITQNKTNSLSTSSKQLLDKLDTAATITVYSPNIETLNIYDVALRAFKKYSPMLHVKLEQSTPEPEIGAKLKVFSDHVLVIDYKNSEVGVDIQHDQLAEAQISNLIQHAYNNTNNWIAFLSGHNEGDPKDTSEFGLSSFAQLFVKQGMHIITLNLAQQKSIAQNIAALIVANPQKEFLPIESALLHEYLANGGRLLWLTEPDAPLTAFIAEEFGIKPSKGVAIDPQSLQLGSPHPALKIVTSYGDHAITKNMSTATIFPWSAHLQILFEANNWDQKVFLQTEQNTWTYAGQPSKDLVRLSQFKEFAGPLNLGIALTRSTSSKEQHAVVLADSSFIINKYLPLHGNAQLAANIVSWTQDNNRLFIYDTPPLKDLSYHPSKTERFMYQYVFTVLIPLFLAAVGWYQHKRKTG